MQNILLVEDEQNVAAFIKKGLEEEGYAVEVAHSAESARETITTSQFDMYILDVILPGISGLELCKQLRKEGVQTPILMLTALSSTENVVQGLDSGADDYLAKPFKFQELLARINAIARRAQKYQNSQLLTVGKLTLDKDAKTASRAGTEIKLTSTEYKLLEYMMVNSGKVLSRVELLKNVWDLHFDVGTNVVDVYVNYLRNKIDKEFKVKMIQTVIGMGYILKDEA
ncbi:winged helix family two component transcriptional regulator [Roseivirga ehrenbergii]|uniref:Two-component system response regulator n=1 Tax=Roseivirga ehrenbergii (strain DSM 102268 / JCM 13514 / KCTC 12282 / NCIMB 14502 / KMM 6017) TaxID=279360 RepID=A0A150WZ04_ROSEK|nr:response regulator transcription factor [Roseivirga ehrenbergii]KYG71718.1 two-component system response regulator [Roseivirga ehrenbergii]TCL07588.1 winged helix family two component transcriptional regulator [Roseivirga ehrenbergii]